MAVTSHDVARLAGVSQPTVSRALRNDPRVSVETRKRVAEAARALSYVPSEMGRALSTRSTKRVAVLADLANPLYPLLVPAIHDVLEAEGFGMVVLAEREDDADGYAPLLDRSVDGVIVSTARVASALPIQIQQRGLPMVLLNRTSDIAETDSVAADNHSAGYQATQMLLASGHRVIGLLAGPQETSTARDREAGVRSALADADLVLRPRHVARNWFGHDSGMRGMQTLMNSDGPPEAVVCVSDSVAVGALNAARLLGLQVPGDVGVVGIDDVPYAAWPIVNLSTVSVPLTAMAEMAARMLVERITGRLAGPASHQVHPVLPVLRGTHDRESLPNGRSDLKVSFSEHGEARDRPAAGSR